MSKIFGAIVFFVGLLYGIIDIVYYWNNIISIPPDINHIWLWLNALIAGFLMFIGVMIARQ